jgi:hypothetical protein
MLDGTGHVGCEVYEDGSDMGKIEPAGEVLRGIVKDHRHIDRERAEHFAQVIGAVVEVEGIGIEGDRPGGRRQGGVNVSFGVQF